MHNAPMAVKRECLAEQIRQQLIQRIVSGQLAPGERITELGLAREFGTSQTPVREALTALAFMRLVESVPHKGVRVRDISIQETAESYALRGVLEQYAGELAAPLVKGRCETLAGHLLELHKAAEAQDKTAYAKHDWEFHRWIVAATQNETLLRQWDALAFEFRTPMNLARTAVDLQQIVPEHDPIHEALQQGDGPLAGRLLRTHAESFIPTESSTSV